MTFDKKLMRIKTSKMENSTTELNKELEAKLQEDTEEYEQDKAQISSRSFVPRKTAPAPLSHGDFVEKIQGITKEASEQSP